MRARPHRGSLPALAWFVAVACGLVVAGNDPLDPPTQRDTSPEEVRLLAMSAPGEHHDHLGVLAGSWTATVKFWPVPGAEPMVTTGSAENELILDGRFLETRFRSEVEGRSFEGRQLLGHDNSTGRYVAVWIDSMSTGVLQATGVCAGGGSVWTLEGKRFEPAEDREVEHRWVIRMQDANHHVFEMHDQLEDGRMFKSLEIRYERD